jgi:hypothetical protein
MFTFCTSTLSFVDHNLIIYFTSGIIIDTIDFNDHYFLEFHIDFIYRVIWDSIKHFFFHFFLLHKTTHQLYLHQALCTSTRYIKYLLQFFTSNSSTTEPVRLISSFVYSNLNLEIGRTDGLLWPIIKTLTDLTCPSVLLG